MKYAVIKSVNGNFSIDSEWDNLQSAIMQWHSVCRALWAESTVETATVAVVNQQLEDVESGKYKEFISHTVNA